MRARGTAVLVALLGACGATGPVEIPASTTRFDAIEPVALREFRAARAAFDGRDLAAAQAGFERLLAREPDNVCVGTWLQECELARGDDPALVAERWASRARSRPSAANEVLAARVASSAGEREAALARAETRDPACAWVPYARAFERAQKGDFTAARALIARAKECDPGHLWTWWLEGWIATRTQSAEDAVRLVEGFVIAAAEDPRIPRSLLDEARLDLALLLVLTDEPKAARDAIASVDASREETVRKLAALAIVRQALGDLRGALAAAEDAAHVAPGDMLPVVQQALLFDEWLHDEARAEAAWKRALDMARSSTRLVSVLERTRAGVRLERFAAKRAKRGGP